MIAVKSLVGTVSVSAFRTGIRIGYSRGSSWPVSAIVATGILLQLFGWIRARLERAVGVAKNPEHRGERKSTPSVEVFPSSRACILFAAW